jgi:hypothetical protein
MTDLIWFGNTLLPRWFVFGAPIAILLAVVFLVVIVRVRLIASRLSRPPHSPTENVEGSK